MASSRSLQKDFAIWTSGGVLTPSNVTLARALATEISRSADATTAPFGAAWLKAYDASTGDPHPLCRARGYATVSPGGVARLVVMAVHLRMIDALNGNPYFADHVTWLGLYLIAGPQNWSRLASVTTPSGHTYVRGKGKFPAFGPVNWEAALRAATISVDSLGHWYCEHLVFHASAPPSYRAC